MIKILEYKWVALAFIIGAVGARIFIPKTEVKEVIKYQTVVQKQQDASKKKKVVIVEKKNSDGSSTKETTIDENSNSKTEVNIDTKDSQDNLKVTSNAGITIGIIAIKPIEKNMLTQNTNYGMITNVPIIDNLSVTGFLSTEKRIGLGLSIQF